MWYIYCVTVATVSVFVQPAEETRSPELKEALDECGFVYYLILARLYDIDPNLNSRDRMLQSMFLSMSMYLH